MKLQQFDGGLHTKKRPQFLALNQGAVYENINNDLGTLNPVKSALETSISSKPYPQYYIAKDQWISSDAKRDYVEFQKKLYWTDRGTRPQKYDGTNTQNLGIDIPPKLASISATTWAKPFDDYAIVSKTDDTTGLTNAIQHYLLMSTRGGKVSATTYVSVATNGKVLVLNEFVQELPKPGRITTDDSGVKRQLTFKDVKSLAGSDKLTVYRYYKEEWRAVGDITNTAKSLVDKTEDISAKPKFDEANLPPLKGVYQYVMTYYNSADGAESGPSDVSAEVDLKLGGYATLNNIPMSSDSQVDLKRLYRVGGSKTKFTLLKELANNVTSFIDKTKDTDMTGGILSDTSASPAPSGLAYLTEAYAMLFGAVDDQLRFTPTGEPDSWPKTYFIQYESPITGIAPVANGILVFTRFRTHIVTGTGPLSLSSYLLSGDQGCIAYESVQLRGPEAWWASSDGICRSSGNKPEVITKLLLGKLSLDPIDSIVYDETYYLLNRDKRMLTAGDGIFRWLTQDVSTLDVAKDKLYGYRDGKLWELFQSESAETFKYLSPRFIEGQATDAKTYKKFFIYSKGRVIINILIDDQVVATKELTTEDNHTIQVPQNMQRGYFCQISVEGTGEVYELEYKVG